MKTMIEGHRYQLSNHEPGSPEQEIQFIQKEPVGDDGTLRTVANGTTNEEVLRLLIERLNYLQKKFPCRENAIAITHIETALLWLGKRTADREARGVEGKHKA